MLHQPYNNDPQTTMVSENKRIATGWKKNDTIEIKGAERHFFFVKYRPRIWSITWPFTKHNFLFLLHSRENIRIKKPTFIILSSKPFLIQCSLMSFRLHRRQIYGFNSATISYSTKTFSDSLLPPKKKIQEYCTHWVLTGCSSVVEVLRKVDWVENFWASEYQVEIILVL